ncbi:MAG: MBL fold metallo-hydrolase [Spirochaetes bacterium]|nr:MBL fold metallo-hydrolase [Spirochaetota bacterium]
MAGMTMEALAGRTRIVAGATNVGIFAPGDGSAVFVDSGNDADGGRKLLKAAEAEGLRVSGLVLTHSNADHAGGAAFMKARSGCRVAASPLEAAVVEHPFLEPSLLWGGMPPRAIRGKFLMAEPCAVDDRVAAPGPVPGTELTLVPLPGHFLEMVGVRTPDRVLFCADTVASSEILRKYRIFYLRDPGAQLQTLAMLETFDADWFVPSHAAATRDIRPLVAENRAQVLEIAQLCVDACAEPAGPDEVLASLARRYGLQMNHAQYALVGSTVRSYLSWLCDGGKLDARFEGGCLRYQAT